MHVQYRCQGFKRLYLSVCSFFFSVNDLWKMVSVKKLINTLLDTVNIHSYGDALDIETFCRTN